MYTTIEPCLIARLNNDGPPDSYASPSLELPPLHNPNLLKASGRPLLLEPDASSRTAKLVTEPSLVAQHTTLITSADDSDTSHIRGDRVTDSVPTNVDRVLGGSSPQSLRKILDDGHESGCRISSKKRHITDTKKDDFVQLPQPPKKQKAAKQVVPPIIIGLFEPPPQAALFPPIASSSFHDSHGRNTLNTAAPKVKEPVGEVATVSYFEGNERTTSLLSHDSKSTRVRARKKWTDDETNNLLLGVYKHGVGNWTDILEDSSFSFNSRSGADLKDRFRTCCPSELRGTRTPYPQRGNKNHRSTSSLLFENILIEDEGGHINLTEHDGISRQPRKSRAHRKELQDLAQLGIEGPFRKSHRRERRPFSEQEDSEILEGYKLHGPAWTRIQRDSRFHLLSRQPTDLRDRLRNKHPEKFQMDNKIRDKKVGATSRKAKDKQCLSSKREAQSVGKLRQPSIVLQNLGTEKSERVGDTNGKDHVDPIAIPVSSPIHQPSSREGRSVPKPLTHANSKVCTVQPPTYPFISKDNFNFPEPPGVDSADALPFSQSFDWSGTVAAPFASNMGEMDISRLLLDESWPEIPNSSVKDKQSFTDISSILTSSAETSGTGFYSMLEDTQLVDLQDNTF